MFIDDSVHTELIEAKGQLIYDLNCVLWAWT